MLVSKFLQVKFSPIGSIDLLMLFLPDNLDLIISLVFTIDSFNLDPFIVAAENLEQAELIESMLLSLTGVWFEALDNFLFSSKLRDIRLDIYLGFKVLKF